MKFALQWTCYFDEVGYGTIKEYNVDEVINADDVLTWIDEHMLKLQQDLKVSCTEAPCHIDDDIEWNWRFLKVPLLIYPVKRLIKFNGYPLIGCEIAVQNN